MTDEPKVRLFKQTFLEYLSAHDQNPSQIGGLEFKPVGLVFGANSDTCLHPADRVSKINERLADMAEGLGANTVFGIEYRPMAGESSGTVGYGDAYLLK